MAGLALKVGGFGGVGTTGQPEWGTPSSYNSVSSAAFGPAATVEAPSTFDVLSPNDGCGLAFCGGVVAVVLLVLIRQSLPGK
jgi:hypothetical protein